MTATALSRNNAVESEELRAQSQTDGERRLLQRSGAKRGLAGSQLWTLSSQLNSYGLGWIRRVIFCEGGNDPANSGAQLGWRHHFGSGAPTEYPLFNFIESPEAQTKFQPPAWQFTHLL